MANVSIGGTTPALNPREMTVVKADKTCSRVETYTGVAYFAWAATIVGKVITLIWDEMTGDTFNTLDGYYSADTTVVFNPNDGRGVTYNAKIMKFDGKYLLGLGVDSVSIRNEVVMELLIISQV